jgi:hypothetical protein
LEVGIQIIADDEEHAGLSGIPCQGGGEEAVLSDIL